MRVENVFIMGGVSRMGQETRGNVEKCRLVHTMVRLWLGDKFKGRGKAGYPKPSLLLWLVCVVVSGGESCYVGTAGQDILISCPHIADM